MQLVHLSPEELIQLTGLANGTNRKATRAKALLLANCGQKVQQISDSVGLTKANVAMAIISYLESGLDACIRPIAAHPPCRPRLLSPEVIDRIKEILEERPPNRGKWTRKSLQQEIIKRGILPKISQATLGRGLTAAGITDIFDSAPRAVYVSDDQLQRVLALLDDPSIDSHAKLTAAANRLGLFAPQKISLQRLKRVLADRGKIKSVRAHQLAKQRRRLTETYQLHLTTIGGLSTANGRKLCDYADWAKLIRRYLKADASDAPPQIARQLGELLKTMPIHMAPPWLLKYLASKQ